MRTKLSAVRVSPQVKDYVGVSGIMLDVIVALIPALGMSVYFFGPRVLVLTAISVMSSVGFEALYCILVKKPVSVGDLSACVTGLLLAMTLPVTAPYWAPVLGALFAIVIVKQFYGGLGKNFMNPALSAHVLLLSFPGMMTTWVDALDRPALWGEVDAVSSATPMAYLHLGELPPLSLRQMILGVHGGAVGEVASFMLILGGLYLLGRRVISWRIPVTFLGTVAILTLIFPRGDASAVEWMLYHLLSGGLLLGAIFMACDYTTSPVTLRGQLLYGTGCGVFTVVLRYFSSYPDGVGFAILTMNCCVWLLDRMGLPRQFGTKPLTQTKLWVRRQLARLAKLRPVLPRLEPRTKGTMPGEMHLDGIRRGLSCVAALAVTVAVSAVCINQVYLMTLPVAMERESREERALLEQVMPQANLITQTPYVAEGALHILAGYQGSELIGHCIEVETQGFGGVITLVVGVDVDGKVTGVTVTGDSENPNNGGRACQADYLSGYIGLSGTVRTQGENAVDAISGATDTCRAITAGVNKALYIASRLESGDVGCIEGDV